MPQLYATRGGSAGVKGVGIDGQGCRVGRAQGLPRPVVFVAQRVPGRHPGLPRRRSDLAGSQAFFDHVKAEGVPFDVIGLSYYSFWHGPLTALKANLDNLAERYGKPVMIAGPACAATSKKSPSSKIRSRISCMS